jgi:3-oxoadipate enol-lactonase
MNTPLPNYTTQGTGSTAVFLLHGVGGGRSSWESTQTALARQGYQAVAWDMPGYGSSSAVSPYTMHMLAQSLHTLVAHIGAQRNVLVGHSMGGMVAQEALAMGVQTTHAVDAAVFYATTPAFGKAGGDWQQQFLNDRFQPLDAGKGMGMLANDLVRSMFDHKSHASIPLAMSSAQQMMAAVPEATYRAALTAIVSFNQRAHLPHIKIPTLCLSAEHDHNAPPAVMQKMAEYIPQALSLCLPDCGHLAHMECPEVFNATLLKFLQEHVARISAPMPAIV